MLWYSLVKKSFHALKWVKIFLAIQFAKKNFAFFFKTCVLIVNLTLNYL